MAKGKESLEPPPPKPSPSQTEQIDRALVEAALAKRRAGQTPSAAERAALKRFEAQREEDLRWQYYRAVPQKHYRQMAGRQTKILHDQAQLYGLPIDRAEIDLTAVIRAVHDFLATHNQRYRSREVDDTLLDGPSTPALERYRDEKAKLAKLERLERECELLPRDQVHAGLARIASLLRSAGEAIQKINPECYAILDEALADAAQEFENDL